MDLKHTPGPWTVAPHPDDAEFLEIVKDYEEFSEGRKAATWIAECDAGGLDLDIERNAANANLIAAAPDLYAALKLYVEHYGDPLKVARPALAKAEGQ